LTRDTTDSIRTALGVKAADYFGFGAGAVLTEGPSDREIIAWYLGLVDRAEFLHVRGAALHDYGGVKQLAEPDRVAWRPFYLGQLGTVGDSAAAAIGASA
jgi:hypothetical protein